jgi:hypothetical protein
MEATFRPEISADFQGTIRRYISEGKISCITGLSEEARGSVVVKALRYKPEGRGFDNRLGDFF